MNIIEELQKRFPQLMFNVRIFDRNQFTEFQLVVNGKNTTFYWALGKEASKMSRIVEMEQLENAIKNVKKFIGG